MSEKNLIELFGSAARVKILKLLLNNPEHKFSLEDISERTKITPTQSKHHIARFIKMGLVKEYHVKEKQEQEKGDKGPSKTKSQKNKKTKK